MRIIFKLDDLLKERNLSHRELSRLTGIRPTTIGDMCNNVARQLPLENLAKICETLECDITDVIELGKALEE